MFKRIPTQTELINRVRINRQEHAVTRIARAWWERGEAGSGRDGSLTGRGASMAAPSPLAASTGLHYSHGKSATGSNRQRVARDKAAEDKRRRTRHEWETGAATATATGTERKGVKRGQSSSARDRDAPGGVPRPACDQQQDGSREGRGGQGGSS